MPSRKNQKHRVQQRYEDALRRQYHKMVQVFSTESLVPNRDNILRVVYVVTRKTDKVEFDEDGTPFVFTEQGRIIAL